MNREDWRPCFLGYYEASSLGRVRRSAPGGGSYAGRLVAARVDRAGYLSVSLKAARAGRATATTFYVHALVAAAFIGPRPEGQQVNHIDADRLNNLPSNLEYVTPVQNQQHMYRLGRSNTPRGERSGHAKLTEEQVRQIRRLRAGGEPIRVVASQFRIGQAAVSAITSRHTWRHLA